jgi:hypothetical protein
LIVPSVSLETWLRMLVEAEDAALAGGLDRRSFILMPRGGMERELDHAGWDPDS